MSKPDLNIEGEGVVEARPSEMEERVAKALHRAHYERGRRLYPVGAWEALDRFEREMWFYSARSAIEAMTEPTEAMLAAGLAAFRSHDPRVCDPRDTVEEIIREAITAALSPSGADR